MAAHIIHVVPVTPVDPEKFSAAVRILRGTPGYFALCWASMITSVTLATYGFAAMNIDDEMSFETTAMQRLLAFQSIAFICAQSFTLAKVTRDQSMGSLKFGGVTAHDDELVLAFIQPTLPYRLQAVGFYMMAVGFCIFSLGGAHGKYTAFRVMVLLWVTVSTLCLSKVTRDRHDANIWEKLPAGTQAMHIEHVLQVASGSYLYMVLVWLSAILSVFGTLGWMAAWDDDRMNLTAKGFFAICFLFAVSAAFHFAKLVRDRADPVKGKELQDQKPYQFIVVLGFVLSSMATIAGSVRLPQDFADRLFLGAGGTFAVMAALYLAKDVRDRLETRRVRAMSEPEGTCAVSAGAAYAAPSAPAV